MKGRHRENYRRKTGREGASIPTLNIGEDSLFGVHWLNGTSKSGLMQKGGGAKGGGRFHPSASKVEGSPKCRASSPFPQQISFFLSLVVSSWNLWPRFEAVAHPVRVWASLGSFCASPVALHPEKNRGFLHEHPRHVSSWSSTPMKALCSWADTTVTRCDMCMFGDGTWHRVGNRWVKRPSQRRTGWEPAFQNRLTRCQPLATAGIFTQAGQQAG